MNIFRTRVQGATAPDCGCRTTGVAGPVQGLNYGVRGRPCHYREEPAPRKWAAYSVQGTVDSANCALYILHCTVCSVHKAVVQPGGEPRSKFTSALHTHRFPSFLSVQVTLYSISCTQYTIYCLMYTVHAPHPVWRSI